MIEDFSKMTDEELEKIIRLHENPNVPGSRFQRAMTELDLRYKKRGYGPGIHFEVGGNMTMDGNHITLPENHQMTAKIKGDYASKNSKITQGKNYFKKLWNEKPLGQIVIGVIIGLIVYFLTLVLSPKLIKISNSNKLPESSNAKILDRSVFQLVADTDYINSPLLDTQQKWKNYGGLKTQDEQAIVMNYSDAGQEKTWVDLRSANLYNNAPRVITCEFDSEWRQRIQLLKKNAEDKPITFLGTIRGDLAQGGVPILENCSIK